MPDVESTFQVIRDLLERGGFRQVEDSSHPEAFGSRYAVFGRGSHRVRLIWDGKEEWFAFQEQLGEAGDFRAWEHVITVRVGRGSIDPSSLESLVRAVQGRICGTTA